LGGKKGERGKTSFVKNGTLQMAKMKFEGHQGKRRD
jgi:hypothetical protein